MQEANGLETSSSTQFRAEEASRAVQVVFEADRLHRCQRDLKAAASELQSRLEKELKDQVRSTVTHFTGALAAEAGFLILRINI